MLYNHKFQILPMQLVLTSEFTLCQFCIIIAVFHLLLEPANHYDLKRNSICKVLVQYENCQMEHNYSISLRTLLKNSTKVNLIYRQQKL